MNVPQLRFNGFDGEWEEIKLGELVEFKNGLNYLKSDRGESVYTVGVKNFNHKKLRTTTELETINLSSIPAKEFLLEKDDLLFVRSNGNKELVGRMMLIETAVKNTYYSGFVIRGRIQNKNALEPLFLLSLEGKIKESLKTLTGGTNISNLSQSILNSISLNVPPIQEQKKVASFITLLDRKIEKQKEKIDGLEQFKKGMMQRVFSQELRFKYDDGGEFPEWEIKRVADTGQVVTGNTPSKSIETYWNDPKVPWITPTDIDDSKEISTSSSKLSESGYQKSRKLPANSLLVTCIASIGKNTILKVDGSCNQQINAIIPNDAHDVDFLYYLVEHFNYRIKSIAGTTATAIVNKTTFENLLFQIPVFEEQQKIATLLSKIDEKVEKEKEKLMILEEQKKGFMQGMFV